MMASHRKIALFFVISVVFSTVSASSYIGSMVPRLKVLAATLGWFLMILCGVRWIIADSPNDKADAKKGMMYIVVGMLLIAMYCSLVQLYCDTFMQTLDTSIVGVPTCNIPGCT